MSLRWSFLALLLVASPAMGQDMKAGVMGNPRLGQQAPDFSAPYLTSEGPGPNGQPFHLKAELGHVVVLIFGPQRGPSGDGWRVIAARADSGLGDKSIVIGAVRASVRQASLLTTALGERLKVVADSAGTAFRKFGIRGSDSRWKAFVIADDGTVIHMVSDFKPTNAKAWAGIKKAVSEGRTAIPVGAGSRLAPRLRW